MQFFNNSYESFNDYLNNGLIDIENTNITSDNLAIYQQTLISISTHMLNAATNYTGYIPNNLTPAEDPFYA